MISSRKIPLPWANEFDDAIKKKEALTNKYWKVSRGWNGFESITACDAMEMLSVVISEAASMKVATLSASLKDNIVIHGRKPSLKGANSNQPAAKMIVL